MKTQLAEFPKHPFPHVPQPPEPGQRRVQPPTVYVYEKQAWEYRVIGRTMADEGMLPEAELNALGSEGWELVGVVQVRAKVQFVFKRVKP